jgi:hypothetical protein
MVGESVSQSVLAELIAAGYRHGIECSRLASPHQRSDLLGVYTSPPPVALSETIVSSILHPTALYSGLGAIDRATSAALIPTKLCDYLDDRVAHVNLLITT